MFHAIQADTADQAYRAAAQLFQDKGPSRKQKSRLGNTIEVPRVAISISDPGQRYTFSRLPAINPAFAIAEVVWIMTGRNDAAFLNYFNHSLPKYAGDTPSYHGAYGNRLRSAFGIDQLERAAATLRSQRDSRQVVLQIWDAASDFPLPCGTPVSSDVPCNVTSMLKVRDNRLEWTQILRSNDLFRGVPYNFIQFMTLHEIVAGWIGVEPGCYCHLSDSLHLYESDVAKFSVLESGELMRKATPLNLSYEKTIDAFSRIAAHVDALIDSPAAKVDFASIIDASSLPACYRNILCVLFAEAARRLSDTRQIELVMKRCECSALSLLIANWLDRVQPARQSARSGAAIQSPLV